MCLTGRGSYLNRLVLNTRIRYSFKHTKLRLQQTPDGEFFKTAWNHATTLGRCADYFVDSAVVLAISAVDMASDITGRKD